MTRSRKPPGERRVCRARRDGDLGPRDTVAARIAEALAGQRVAQLPGGRLRPLLPGEAVTPAQPDDGVGGRRRGRGAELAAADRAAQGAPLPVSYTHLRAHETRHDLVC